MNIQPSRFFRTHCFVLAFLAASVTGPLFGNDAPAKLSAGSKLDRLSIGATTYQNVLIRSVTARSAMITYDGGMKSILLHDLSPELQQRFGYSPEAEHAQEAAEKIAQANAEKQQQVRLEALRKSRANSRQSVSKIDQLLRSFGQAPEISEEVDLRPRFSELGLWVKDQGHRPSCAVFAMVSALEFQSAEANGIAQRFSEEYLYWATRKSLNRGGMEGAAAAGSSDEDQSDSGFSLDEVATALRTYGIPLRDRVPNHTRGKVIENPPEETIEEARRGVRLSVHAIPGRDGAALTNNIIQALNLGIPVPVGLRWIDSRVWRVQFLDGQMTQVGNRHAVTIVGYRCKTGRTEDTVFVFKNSWGPHWGQGGYGTASYRYLASNLLAAVVLEVQAEK